MYTLTIWDIRIQILQSHQKDYAGPDFINFCLEAVYCSGIWLKKSIRRKNSITTITFKQLSKFSIMGMSTHGNAIIFN